MLNQVRHRQLLHLMAERGWHTLVLYGQAWRKDFFRCVVNFGFAGPHAAVVLSRSGEMRLLASDPWDAESLAAFGKTAMAHDFAKGLHGLVDGNVAVAGLELMEARFAAALGNAVSATADVEELRRVKTHYELSCLVRAAELADRGYAHFAEVIEEGMAEFELVAEVEGFLKTNGAEDNFMLIASGGTEVTGMRPPSPDTRHHASRTPGGRVAHHQIRKRLHNLAGNHGSAPRLGCENLFGNRFAWDFDFRNGIAHVDVLD